MPSVHPKPRTQPKPRTRKQVGNAVHVPVSSIMSREVVTIDSGTSLDAVAEVMLSRGLSRLPVINQRRELIGVVSKTDLVEQAHGEGDTVEQAPQRGERFTKGFHVHREGPVVDEVMSRNVSAVGGEASIQQAAELMVAQHVHGLPVVTRSGGLIGFISATDILGWLAGLR